MDKKKNVRRYSVLLILIVLAVLGTAATVLAKWYIQSRTTNAVSMDSISAIIEEQYVQDQEVYPGVEADKLVQVKNKGETDCIVRVKVNKVWGEKRGEDGKLIPLPELNTDYIEINYKTDNWYYKEGYYYYKGVLAKDDMTTPLFESFRVSEQAGNEYKGKRADIIVKMECIQAGAEEAKVWSTTFEELGITYERTQEPAMVTTVDFINPETGFAFEKNNGDLFAGFKLLVPGETRAQQIEIANDWDDEVFIYFWAEENEQAHATPENERLIEKLLKEYVDITITDADGKTLYDGPVWGNVGETPGAGYTMKYPIPLGKFIGGQKKGLTVNLRASKDMDNEYQKLLGLVDWVFRASEDNDLPPQEPSKAYGSASAVQSEQDSVYPGQKITYQINYFNHYGDPADVIVKDTLDSKVEFVNAAPEGTFSYDKEKHTVTWNLEEVLQGTGFVEVTVKVKGSVKEGDKVENQAGVRIGNDDEVTTNKLTNPVEEPQQPLEPEPEDPVKSIDRDSEAGLGGTAVEPGDRITYNIQYYNHESAPAEVVITDKLDDGVKFISAGPGGNYDESNRTVIWKISDVPADSYGNVKLTVEVTGQAADKVLNQAGVQIGNSPEVDTNLVENPVEPGTEGPKPPVKSIADIDPAPNADTVKTGDEITYSIRYYNHEEEAVDVTITDVLDKGVDYVSATDGGSYDAATRTVSWKVGKAAPKEFGRVELTVKIREDAVKQVDNEAAAKIGDNQEVKTNKVEKPIEPLPPVTPPVTPPVPPSPDKETAVEGFKKLPLDKEVVPGGTVDYAFIDFGNKLERSMKRYSVTDIFPRGLDFVSAKVPAFTKGEGLTYNVTYITNQNDRRTLHSNVRADKAFVFKAPKLAKGEWIQYLTIDIDEVPSGFGVGDEIVYTCRVTKDVKDKELINEAALGYDGVGIAGEVAPIKIVEPAGRKGFAKTGDSTSWMLYALCAAGAVSVIGGMIFYKKKRAEKN